MQSGAASPGELAFGFRRTCAHSRRYRARNSDTLCNLKNPHLRRMKAGIPAYRPVAEGAPGRESGRGFMALRDTIYVFDIELANSDSNVYESLKVSVARHPSETPEHMLTRVLAYCLEYTEGIALSNGLSEPHEPAIAVRDLTGVLKAWIDVGTPDALRLHRASKAAPRVAVYTHKD